MAHPTKVATRGTEQPTQNRKRNDRGLTTLEWLLIVAAVAGLAALAVVLVQNVVDDTAEQISGSSARLTAANVAAAEITADARASTDPTPPPEAKAKCERLQITYGDALDDGTHPKKPAWIDADADKTPKVDGSDLDPAATANTCLLIDTDQS